MTQNLGPSLEDLFTNDTDDKSAGGKLTQKLIDIKLKEKEDEVARNADALGMQYINLVGFPISTDALTVIPENKAHELKAICFFNNGTEIRLGIVSLTDNLDPVIKDRYKDTHIITLRTCIAGSGDRCCPPRAEPHS